MEDRLSLLESGMAQLVDRPMLGSGLKLDVRHFDFQIKRLLINFESSYSGSTPYHASKKTRGCSFSRPKVGRPF